MNFLLFSVILNYIVTLPNSQDTLWKIIKDVFFQSLVDFMYKAELSLDQTNVQELLIAADMIQLKEAS